jgi:uncharacterized protein (DUF2062 family)
MAWGVAIGIFFGFLPIFGLKTLSAIFVAWLTRSNIIAAVLATTLHDIILPFMPVVYAAEYKVGFWLLSAPHHWPTSLRKVNWAPHAWLSWTTFLTVGKPMLVGSIVCAAPVALASFAITKLIVERHQRKKHADLLASPRLDFEHRPISQEASDTSETNHQPESKQ